MSKSATSARKNGKGVSSKSKLGKENENDPIDYFNEDIPINLASDICVMCKGGHLEGKEMLDILNQDDDHHQTEDMDDLDDEENDNNEQLNHRKYEDPQGIWISKYGLLVKTNRRLFVHQTCARLSPQVGFDGSNWHNVNREIIRSQSLPCRHCRKTGATLGCNLKKCQVVYHVSCAIKIGLVTSKNHMKRHTILCSEHSKDRLENMIQSDIAANQDMTRGRELISIVLNNTIDSTQRLPHYEYIKNNLDSDSIHNNYPDIASVSCCTCTGLCNDINICACLQRQRNYTNQGILVAGICQPIYECNNKCNCSMRRCTNRVVEQGIKFKCNVSRRYIVSHVLSPFIDDNKYWGITLLETVQSGSFIGELKGQYVKGSDKISYYSEPDKKCYIDEEFVSYIIVSCLQQNQPLQIIPLCLWECPIWNLDNLYDILLSKRQDEQLQQQQQEQENYKRQKVEITTNDWNAENVKNDKNDRIQMPKDIKVTPHHSLNNNKLNTLSSSPVSPVLATNNSKFDTIITPISYHKSNNSKHMPTPLLTTTTTITTTITTTSSNNSNNSNKDTVAKKQIPEVITIEDDDDDDETEKDDSHKYICISSSSSSSSSNSSKHSTPQSMKDHDRVNIEYKIQCIQIWLLDEICLDTRYYSNIVRFIPTSTALYNLKTSYFPITTTNTIINNPMENSAAVHIHSLTSTTNIYGNMDNQVIPKTTLNTVLSYEEQPILTAATTTTSSTQTSHNQESNITQEIKYARVNRHLIYTDHFNNYYPKLALFASSRIDAETDLLL